MQQREVDTRQYVSALRSLIEEGKDVCMTISGSSMSPFLIHHRDSVSLSKPDSPLRKGDIAFFQRQDGAYVLHRICKTTPEGYYFIGDAQTEIEGPIKREQIFAIVTKVKRKGRWIAPGSFWWLFFAKVWINIVPLRRLIIKLY